MKLFAEICNKAFFFGDRARLKKERKIGYNPLIQRQDTSERPHEKGVAVAMIERTKKA